MRRTLESSAHIIRSIQGKDGGTHKKDIIFRMVFQN